MTLPLCSQGSYTLPQSIFYLPNIDLPYWLTNGDYRVQGVLGSQGKELGCLKVTLSIHSDWAVSWSLMVLKLGNEKKFSPMREGRCGIIIRRKDNKNRFYGMKRTEHEFLQQCTKPGAVMHWNILFSEITGFLHVKMHPSCSSITLYEHKLRHCICWTPYHAF